SQTSRPARAGGVRARRTAAMAIRCSMERLPLVIPRSPLVWPRRRFLRQENRVAILVAMDQPATKPKGYELPDLREKAVNHKGETQISEKRLYLQLQVYTGCSDPKPLAEALKASGLESVLYLDVNDPRGVALLALSEDPAVYA